MLLENKTSIVTGAGSVSDALLRLCMPAREANVVVVPTSAKRR